MTQTIKQQLEREMMVKIIIGLRHGKLSQEKAQVLAREYLAVTNTHSEEEMLSKLFLLIERYAEMLDVYVKVASQFFADQKEKILLEARSLLAVQNYDAALSVLKGENN